MNPAALQFAVQDLIYREAQLLDEKDWQQWLSLYTADAVFWMPAWASESETTNDPENELNLIYLQTRQSLEDRVFRIGTGQSFASVPLDRTVHLVSNVRITAVNEPRIDARASWFVHVYGRSGSQTRGGWYEYQLQRDLDALHIVRKKVVMIDDKLIGPVDIYHV